MPSAKDQLESIASLGYEKMVEKLTPEIALQHVDDLRKTSRGDEAAIMTIRASVLKLRLFVEEHSGEGDEDQ